MPEYSLQFKKQMVQKLVGPGKRTANQLAKEVEIPQQTLSRWKRELAEDLETPKMPGMRPQDWSAADRLKVLIESGGLSEAELGAFLRRKGLHSTDLEQWRSVAQEALVPRKKQRRKPTAEQREIRRLERELTRKEKALAEAAALLILKKKVQAIWGDEDDGTRKRRGN